MGKRQKGKIAYIHTNNSQMLSKLMAIGALPGTSLVLLQRFPSYLIKIGHSQFAIDKSLAEQIHVRVIK